MDVSGASATQDFALPGLRQAIPARPSQEVEQGRGPFFSEVMSSTNPSPLLTPCSTPQYIPPLPDDIGGWLRSLNAKTPGGAQSHLWLTRTALLLQGFLVVGVAYCYDSLNNGIFIVLALSALCWGMIERGWWLPAATQHNTSSQSRRQRQHGRFVLQPCTVTLLFELISPQVAIW